MILIGLTGSIGMGKSTVLRFFADQGCAVWDADTAVHRLYAPGGAAVEGVETLFPGTTSAASGVDRGALADRLRRAPDGFAQLEALVHPLVRRDRETFLSEAREQATQIAVVDVPLLFETGAEAQVDVVVVVSAPAAIQRQRVLARPGMTVERFEQILARQLPDADKRARADFIIETGGSLDDTRQEVASILWRLSTPEWQARRSGTLHRPDERGE
ncbi:MAG: dephospho-CoA kinase [Caulobacterales bacterium]|nr:dephospho-CoA kinase [Caulobacterales bacterium]